MGLTMGASGPLTSWTRTLNEEDALTLLDSAQPGCSVPDWEELGDRLLPQASPNRRRELVRMVREELLDHHDGVILDSTWLRLLQAGSPHRRLGLLYGRLWQNRPVLVRALEELVLPALREADRPLARYDSDLIDAPAWDGFLRSVLRPDVPIEAFAKTRSTLQAGLRAVGTLEIGATRERATRVRHGRPDPLAFSWVLAREIRDFGEHSEAWATRESFAARVFAPTHDYAATCVDAGVREGLLHRGHLMGQSRLHVGPEMH